MRSSMRGDPRWLMLGACCVSRMRTRELAPSCPRGLKRPIAGAGWNAGGNFAVKWCTKPSKTSAGSYEIRSVQGPMALPRKSMPLSLRPVGDILGGSDISHRAAGFQLEFQEPRPIFRS